jgi:hypothetical protein
MMSLDAVVKHYGQDQPGEESLDNVFLALRGQVKGKGRTQRGGVSSDSNCGIRQNRFETKVMGWSNDRGVSVEGNYQLLGVSQ